MVQRVQSSNTIETLAMFVQTILTRVQPTLTHWEATRYLNWPDQEAEKHFSHHEEAIDLGAACYIGAQPLGNQSHYGAHLASEVSSPCQSQPE